jgi:hypothetical protein
MTSIAVKMTNTPGYSAAENPRLVVIFRFGFDDNGQFVI